MNCPRCALSNLPYFEACSFCETVLQPVSDASQKKEEWNRLSEPLREEFMGAYERGRERFARWRESLRQARFRHAGWGGAIYGVTALVTQAPFSTLGGFGTSVMVLFDVATGMTLGLLLNLFRGGEYRGTFLFGGAYAASVTLKALAGVILNPFEGGVLSAAGLFLFIFSGFLIALILGYIFGLNLVLERFDE